MSQPALRISEAAQRLGTNPSHLRQRLHQLGAITPEGRAHPEWVREGWLKEEQFQYQHPVVGWRWSTRIDITEAGLVELFGQLDNAA
ncbi:hypothetical protein MWU49_09255 [Alcanivorax sp. S6407]|uniref:hypothetical protein n=1 Tax=Alcanivorax sp. S6407 TaxID=2926424 RepID=UPI001FF5AC40|nr:hypothetical protein [Alcanivorax sp. S6407]MCK0153890.1 hypothetical protein [Alcanivorax sp. S6407]